MVSNPFHIVDVFAERKYAGNQLAVVTDAGDLNTETMQAVAREINYSETTFVTDSEPTDAGYGVRIFTPTVELPFAGHPTLGTAAVLRETVAGRDSGEIVIDLERDSIPVTVEAGDGDGDDGGGDGGNDDDSGSDDEDRNGTEVYWMAQNPPAFETSVDRESAARVLDLDPAAIDERYEPEVVSTGLPKLLVPTTSIDAVRRARIDEAFVAEHGAKAILVFAPETVDTDADLHARMFAPALGVPRTPRPARRTAVSPPI